jgi:hypothetical protein
MVGTVVVPNSERETRNCAENREREREREREKGLIKTFGYRCEVETS